MVGGDRLADFELRERVMHYVNNYPTCFHAQALLVDMLEQDGTEEALNQAREACRKLMHTDQIREKYWVRKDWLAVYGAELTSMLRRTARRKSQRSEC